MGLSIIAIESPNGDPVHDCLRFRFPVALCGSAPLREISAAWRWPSRGPRPGGPADDSPARERWVSSPVNNQPRPGRQNPFPHAPPHPIASPSPDSAKEQESDKPQSREAAKAGRKRGTRIARIPVRFPASFRFTRNVHVNRRVCAPAFFASSRLRVSPPHVHEKCFFFQAPPAEGAS